MGFVIVLSAILGVVVFAVSYPFTRRRRWIAPALGLLLFVGSLAWFLTPLCVPMSPEDIARSDPPIETRTDTGMLGQRYFQEIDGVWAHCKVRIARQIFL